MPTTSAGEPSRIARVKRLRTKVSNVRRVRTRHCVNPLATGRLITSPGLVVARRRGGGLARCVGAAVRVGETTVEIRDGADPELLECVVEGADEADASAARHEHDAIASREVVDRVGGEHDCRRSVGESTQAVDDLRARDRVETRCRFVEEEHLRIGEQLDRDAGALALAATQCGDPDVAVLGQAHGVEGVTDRVVDVGWGGR